MSNFCKFFDGLSFVLILITLSEIHITVFLLSNMTNFLYYTNTHISTASSLIASLVTFPTSIKIHYAQTRNIETVKHQNEKDKLRYQKILLTICTVLHIAATGTTFVSMGYTSILEDVFVDSMKKYQSSKGGAKVIVDQIQIGLECCGSDEYNDWFKIDWTGSAVVLQRDLQSRRSAKDEEVDDNETEETEGYLDEGVRWDTVPFSCCKIHAKEPCVTKDLEQLGATTINTNGCSVIIYFRAIVLFLTELFINGIISIILLTLYLPTSKYINNKCLKTQGYDKNTQYPNSRRNIFKHFKRKKSNGSTSNLHSDTTHVSPRTRLPAGYFQIQPPTEYHLYNHSSTYDTKNRISNSKTEQRCHSRRSSNSSTNDETLAIWMNYKPYTKSSNTAELKISSHEEHVLKGLG